MANQEHLDILKQGSEEWNKWRQEHLKAQANLRRADLSGADLSNADLSDADFTEAMLSGADLSHSDLERAVLDSADLKGATLRGIVLKKANLSKADLIFADLSDADLTKAVLDGADLSYSNLGRAVLDGADLSSAHLTEANLRWASLHRTTLRGAILKKANLSKADLIFADLSDADLTKAVLDRADLSYSNLGRAVLDGADLSSVNFTEANLSKANLSRAILTGTILHSANLEGLDLSHCELALTILGDIDLSAVEGLESVRHASPSSIGIDTLYRSGGNIPEVFLRGAGVPDSFISYVHSLVNQPIEYYSCFISYSTQDQPFAEKLYSDLQSVGVRCWFAPVDLKTGDKLLGKFDEAILVYDKLLLILSRDSVSSQWVEKEVEIALDLEIQQGRAILFPIRLDDSVMDSTSVWSSHLRTTKQIGDFRYWEIHEKYQEAFARLIRDLTLSFAQESGKQERNV